MLSSGHADCPYCGLAFAIPFGEGSDTLACPSCGRTVSILAHKSGRLKAVPAEPPTPPGSGRYATQRPPSGKFAHHSHAAAVNCIPSRTPSGAYGPVRPASGRLAAPACQTSGSGRFTAPGLGPESSGKTAALRPKTTSMPKRKADGRDELLLAEARQICANWGWSCSDWQGRKAFAAQAVLDGKGNERPECINITVFSLNGLLGFETIVGPLPAPPWMPLREALNRLNMRSGGSIYLLRECGIVARYKLFQREAPFDALIPEQLMRTVRQLAFDCKTALPLLEADALAAEPAQAPEDFGKPCLVSGLTPLSLKRLNMLAIEAGYHAISKNGSLYLSRQECGLQECKVWLALNGGVLRGFAVPGHELELHHAGERWDYFRRLMERFHHAPARLSRAQVDNLLERLNAANELPRKLSYIWNGERVLAMAVYPHADRSMEAPELEALTECLLDFASAGRVEEPHARAAV